MPTKKKSSGPSRPSKPSTQATRNKELYLKYKASTDEKERLKLRNLLVEANMPFVTSKAQQYQKQSTAVHVELEDLTQAGSLGLIRALETYDPEKGAFSTYAAWWIRSQFQAVASKSPVVSRPRSGGKPYKILVAEEKFRAKHGMNPTPEDLGVRQKDVDGWDLYAASIVSFDEILLDAPARLDGVLLSRHDTIADTSEHDEEREHQIEFVRRVMDTLDTRERRIVKGMIDGHTVQRVARDNRLTPERVQEIYDGVLGTFREALCPDLDMDEDDAD